jgi:hypothetical protein
MYLDNIAELLSTIDGVTDRIPAIPDVEVQQSLRAIFRRTRKVIFQAVRETAAHEKSFGHTTQITLAECRTAQEN